MGRRVGRGRTGLEGKHCPTEATSPGRLCGAQKQRAAHPPLPAPWKGPPPTGAPGPPLSTGHCPRACCPSPLPPDCLLGSTLLLCPRPPTPWAVCTLPSQQLCSWSPRRDWLVGGSSHMAGLPFPPQAPCRSFSAPHSLPGPWAHKLSLTP